MGITCRRAAVDYHVADTPDIHSPISPRSHLQTRHSWSASWSTCQFVRKLPKDCSRQSAQIGLDEFLGLCQVPLCRGILHSLDSWRHVERSHEKGCKTLHFSPEPCCAQAVDLISATFSTSHKRADITSGRRQYEGFSA